MAYSYDAPSTYINFSALSEQDDENADSWFDVKSKGAEEILTEELSSKVERMIKKSLTPCSKAILTPRGKQTLPLAVVTPVRKSEGGPNTDNCETKAVDGTLPEEENVLSPDPKEELQTSCASEKKAASSDVWKMSSTESGTRSRRTSRRLSGHRRTEQQRKQLAKIRADRQAAAKENEHPPVKKQKVVSNTSLAEGAPNCSALSTGAGNQELFSPKGKAKCSMTIPTTPIVLRRKNSANKMKSTEELELEKMQQLQREVAEHRKKNEEFLKTAIAGAGQPTKKVVIEPTKPIDFHFRTDERLKQHGGTQSGSYKEVDFTAELRKHPPSPARVPKGPTVPKPFHLSCGNKRKYDEANASEFVSLAQQIEAFQRSTPSRYHLRNRKKEETGPSPVKPMKNRITIPKTPALETLKRSRPVTCKSAAELEEEELEKIKQYKFKAQELDTRILEGGPLLPKKPPVKEPTQPVGFNLEIEKRIQQREPKKQEEEKFVFHPLPCPTKILQDRVGVPEKKPAPPTVPMSPAFALKNRVRLPKEEEEKEEPHVIKANPLPHFGVPFKPKPLEQKNVEVCPFSFDVRDKIKQVLKEKRIEELRKDEVPKFKALPLPDFDQVSLPPKAVKPTTNPEPFHLRIDGRGTMKAERWEQMIQEKLKQEKEATCFKARPNVVTHSEPFVPKKENRPPIEGLSDSIVQESFVLATEKRAQERIEFEKRLAEKETLIEKKEEERRRYLEEQEKEEMLRLREEAVHKANPIRKYKAFEVKPSDHPLTVPVSPKFSDRFCK